MERLDASSIDVCDRGAIERRAGSQGRPQYERESRRLLFVSSDIFSPTIPAARSGPSIYLRAMKGGAFEITLPSATGAARCRGDRQWLRSFRRLPESRESAFFQWTRLRHSLRGFR